ncbi:polysaccharide pyruvyl transferase family protein [Providencia sp. R33]|uniref:polysaccharide pyruvyl transferase family protein n=1 Tax=Providencia sp. R33 TaxID=2828763 RepID=UPI001C5B72A9|nr:polysaccharide pyruvyl transferase family protein [Providencia sp. R33]QXX81915.1 polysaccharide pyruvyl transferase family protein [Providencia sp. R33]
MKILVTNVFGPLNLGDFELFSTLIKKISINNNKISAIARDPKLCSEHFPNINFYEQLGKASNPLYRIIYLLLCFLYIFSFFRPLCKLLLPSDQYNALASLKKMDLVIGCPGGFLEDSSFSFYTHAMQVYICSKLSKKMIMSPMSIGPVKNKFNLFILKSCLKNIEIIFTREEISHELCNSLKLNNKLSSDLAFDEFIENNKINNHPKNKKVYFTVINWNFPNYNQKEKEVLFEKYIDSLVDTAKFIYEKYKFEIKIINQVDSDSFAIDQFHQKLLNLSVPSEIVFRDSNPKQVMNELKNAELVIASRFHSAIFSLNVGAPVIAISYLPKTTGMLDLYGASELYQNIDSINTEDLIALSDKFINDNESYLSIRSVFQKNLMAQENNFDIYLNNEI